MCHKIKHIGFWCYTEDGRKQLTKAGLNKEDLVNHFCKVNSCSTGEFKKYEEEALKLWRERSRYKWKQDFGEYDPKKRLE